MTYRVPKTRTPPRNAFWRAFFQTLGGAGDVYGPSRPARYPQDAHYQDFVRVGEYIRGAMEVYDDQIAKEETHKDQPSLIS